MKSKSVESFYQDIASYTNSELNTLLPEGISKEIGHFNVFDAEELFRKMREAGKITMPYNRRAYYKISLIKGHNIAEYADKTIEIKKHALLFATPKIPYNYLPLDMYQSGYFCIFTDNFLIQSKSGVVLDDLPIFRAGGYPIFELAEDDIADVEAVFRKMQKELASDYVYKYDLIRNYVLELIHYGQKLQPTASLYNSHNASARVASLFVELLERQFPIESPAQRINLRTAKDYAERLAVHVNHLNKVLKESLGKTTTSLIGDRIAQEAKLLLKQTDWNVSEIAYALGFEEVAHFSNFFRKQTSLSPVAFRA